MVLLHVRSKDQIQDPHLQAQLDWIPPTSGAGQVKPMENPLDEGRKPEQNLWKYCEYLFHQQKSACSTS